MKRIKKNDPTLCEVDFCSLICNHICVGCGTKVCLHHDETSVRLATNGVRKIAQLIGHPCLEWRAEFLIQGDIQLNVAAVKCAEIKK